LATFANGSGADGFEELLAQADFEVDAVPLDVGGEIVPVDLSGARVGAGDQEAMLVIARDASERVSLQNQLRQAQKLEAMGQLTGGIAHDFNNLLTAVALNIEALKRRIGREGETEAIADQIERALDRGQAMTHRLLAFARQQPVAPRVCEVRELVQASIEMLERALPHHVQIQSRCANDLHRVSIDPNQFQDALLNLAINARDAMPTGGRLTIGAENVVLDRKPGSVGPGRYVSVVVSDTGAGMSQETMRRAFEPFFTTKPEGRGTGLGLSMVYGFARQAGGEVSIESALDRGTTITLLLPEAGSAMAQHEALA
jgi:signal transduction histidine kinase